MPHTINDISGFVIADGNVAVTSTLASLTVTLVNPAGSAIEITDPGSVSVVEVITAGPQGAPGVQNVYVGTSPPSSPQIDWIWIDTN